MNKERVQMLRDMMDGVPEEQVDLKDYYIQNGEPCGTIACISGWAAIYPPFVEMGFRKHNDYPFYDECYGSTAASKFFEVDSVNFYTRQPGEVGTDKEIALRRLDNLLAIRTDVTTE